MPEPADIVMLNARLGALHDDVGEMKLVLRELTSAITKLALIEERQAQAQAAQERAFKVIESLETRLSTLEKQMPHITSTSRWVDRAVAGTVVGAAVFVAKKTGLM